MGNLRPQANPKEALLLPLVYGENIRHKELRARFYLVFQELGLFKQVIEHCLASISPSIQWLGSSHPPGLSELSWELHEMMGISRFLLGLICLGWTWKTARKRCPNTGNHASERLRLVRTPQAGRLGVCFWCQLSFCLASWDFPCTWRSQGSWTPVALLLTYCKRHFSLEATQTTTQPVWVSGRVNAGTAEWAQL